MLCRACFAAACPMARRSWEARTTASTAVLGLFLCTDLRRQLYTMTGWIQRKDFSAVYNAIRRVQDALSANRALSGAVPASSRP
jgi:hypothetical protein